MNPQEQTDYDQPVAYDKEGRPLYAHPPEVQSAAPATGQTPPAQTMTSTPVPDADVEKRHQESVAQYPDLGLSEEEYVIKEIVRHQVGVVMPAAIGSLLGLLIVGLLMTYSYWVPSGKPPFSSLLLPAVALLALIALGTYVVVWVYQRNRLFLTNESIVQQVQLNLFSQTEQEVGLGDIKDISFQQAGIMPLMFNYGTIQLSTEGENKVYTLTSVSNPKHVIAMLNSALEDFKNGRPISSEYLN